MSIMLPLPPSDGKLAPYTLSSAAQFPDKVTRPLNRVALAAADVVADPKADIDPWLKAAPDWERTLAYRHYLWDLGLGVAEAMDTAQRGMGLDWTMALELIRQSVESARGRKGAVIFSGAGTDHLDLATVKTVDDVVAGYEQQIAAIEKVGGRIILMASRALVRVAKSADDYARVYERVLKQ